MASQIPSLTADVRFDLTALLAARSTWNGEHGADRKLSVLVFLAKAALTSLDEFPDFNATITETEMIRWQTVNLGIAVDTPSGLLVPVVRDAQTLGVEQLGQAIRDLGLRARDGVLKAEDLAGGTFTVSNPGAVGPSIRAEALLNPPQVALLGLPGLRREPIVITDSDGGETVQIRSVMSPSLTFDHRAVDGGDAIRYLVSVRDKVQTWDLAQYL